MLRLTLGPLPAGVAAHVLDFAETEAVPKLDQIGWFPFGCALTRPKAIYTCPAGQMCRCKVSVHLVGGCLKCRLPLQAEQIVFQQDAPCSFGSSEVLFSARGLSRHFKAACDGACGLPRLRQLLARARHLVEVTPHWRQKIGMEKRWAEFLSWQASVMTPA